MCAKRESYPLKEFKDDKMASEQKRSTIYAEWGRIVVNGQSFKDLRISPSICEDWDWKVCGTKHQSGITPKAFLDLLPGVTDLILTTGFDGALNIHPDYLAYTNRIRIHTGKTPDCVDLYNRLVKNPQLKVAGCFHSTC
jgi:hypothetical protein